MLRRHAFLYSPATRYIPIERLNLKKKTTGKEKKKPKPWACKQSKNMFYEGKERNTRFHQTF